MVSICVLCDGELKHIYHMIPCAICFYYFHSVKLYSAKDVLSMSSQILGQKHNASLSFSLDLEHGEYSCTMTSWNIYRVISFILCGWFFLLAQLTDYIPWCLPASQQIIMMPNYRLLSYPSSDHHESSNPLANGFYRAAKKKHTHNASIAISLSYVQLIIQASIPLLIFKHSLNNEIDEAMNNNNTNNNNINREKPELAVHRST